MFEGRRHNGNPKIVVLNCTRVGYRWCMAKRILMGKMSSLSPGQAIEKSIMARRIAVFNENGTLYGVESDCKHMRASLAKGGVEHGVLTCNWHGWKYDLRTGKCLTTEGFKLKLYEVEVEGDEIYLIWE